MTTITDTPRTDTSLLLRKAEYKVTGPRVLRSEWAKLWTLRSTWITLAIGLVALVGIGTIAGFRYKAAITSGQPIDPDFAHATAITLTLFGVRLGELAIGVLGVLFTAGEYSNGSIRSTLAAVPRRLPVLWSKTAVYGAVALIVGTVGAFAGFLIANAVVTGTPAHMSLGDAGTVRSLLGAGLYLALIGVIGAALGVILRSIAGGISVLVAVLLLVPGLLSLLPTSWRADVTPYLPSNAGEAIYTVHQTSGMLSPGQGGLVLAGWTAAAIAGAAWRLVRRDA
jgi:ABC-2 type transport system permease protein